MEHTIFKIESVSAINTKVLFGLLNNSVIKIDENELFKTDARVICDVINNCYIIFNPDKILSLGYINNSRHDANITSVIHRVRLSKQSKRFKRSFVITDLKRFTKLFCFVNVKEIHILNDSASIVI